jgi:hypothetical protein
MKRERVKRSKKKQYSELTVNVPFRNWPQTIWYTIVTFGLIELLLSLGWLMGAGILSLDSEELPWTLLVVGVTGFYGYIISIICVFILWGLYVSEHYTPIRRHIHVRKAGDYALCPEGC